MLTIGSLFSGIGGLELGLERAGLGPVLWQAEQSEFCRQVLSKHWPGVKRYEDVREIGDATERADLLCGGFPCQDISQAGRRAGLQGSKSGLWSEFERATAVLRPSWAVVENSGHRWRAWVPAVRRAFHTLGYASVCLRVRAQELGAWHCRSRCFVVANCDGQLLRVQQRRRRWAGWESAILAAKPGAPWVAPDADGEGEPSWAIAEERRRASNGGRQPVEPSVVGGVHGIPHRLDRERALGNAVVPQVAEVIGRGIVATIALAERMQA